MYIQTAVSYNNNNIDNGTVPLFHNRGNDVDVTYYNSDHLTKFNDAFKMKCDCKICMQSHITTNLCSLLTF